MVIEKVSGVSFEEFMRQRFFQPLAMTSARFGDYNEVILGRTAYYARRDKGPLRRRQPYFFAPYIYGSTGLNVRIDDLVMWEAALQGGKILKQRSMEQMWAPVKLADGSSEFQFEGRTVGYGSHWVVTNRLGRKAVGNSGGVVNSLTRFLDDRLTVIVLTNCLGADPKSLVDGVASFYLTESDGGAE
jgi:CubicO group peptidase (beta-lactamase class C family)